MAWGVLTSEFIIHNRGRQGEKKEREGADWVCVYRDDESSAEIVGGGGEMMDYARRSGQRVRMHGGSGSGIVRASPQRSTTSSTSTRNRHTSMIRGIVAKSPSRRGGRAGGRSRGGSSSAGISRLSASSSSALSSTSTSTSLSWFNVHQEQGLHSSSSIQLQHNRPPQQRHPLDLTNAELAAQDMLLAAGTASGDIFGAPAPDPETYPER